MSDFYDLRKPQQELSGIDKGRWYVIAAKHPTGAALVNDGSFELKPTRWTETENTIFYFDTEGEAFSASVAYYTKHGKKHPDLMDCTSGSDPVHNVMEFV